MQNLNFSGNFANSKAKVKLTVGLFQFEEGGSVIIYSPAFDLTGYGKDAIEARNSFEETLNVFLDYTIKKKTFVKELNRLGWHLKATDVKRKKIKAPGLASLISKNDYLAEILNEKDFTKFDQTVSLPVF